MTKMKCIYSAVRPAIEQKSYADWITNCDQKCSISTKGLIAFTGSFCLNQSQPQSCSYHVYVADLNRPYQPYLLTESEHEFTIIEWDPSGSKLLLCDNHGCATIYTSKDFLISDWKPRFKQVFPAETFISVCWYHPGIVNSIYVAQGNIRTSSNHLEYTDKIQQTKFNASLRLFGGKAAEGFVLVSRTGLICCLTFMTDSTVDVVSESLNPLRTRLQVADIGYHKDGSFIVSTSSGSINSTISFYKVSLSVKSITLDDVDSISIENAGSKRVNISSKQFYSFHLNIMSQILNERENTCAFERVNHIKFVSKDSPNDVLIEISGQNLSLIELWELDTKKKSPIHSAILELKKETELSVAESTNAVAIKQEVIDTTNGNQQQQQQQSGKRTDEVNADNSLQSYEWSFKGNYITDKDMVAIQVPKFKIFGSSRQLNIILIAYKDNSVCCLRKEDLQPVDDSLQLSTDVPILMSNGRTSSESDSRSYKVYNGNNNGRNNGRNATNVNVENHFSMPNPNKQYKHRPNYVTDIQFSANLTVFVAVDSMSQLHVVKLPPLMTCQDTKDEETYLQYILEYCLVTGNDWWDVLACVKRLSIETICDRFHDAYERQPKHIQKKYFNRQLMIRASLYRCLNEAASLCKSSDCHTMIMLNSIASTHKSMLRSQEKDSPSDQLSQFLKTYGAQPNFYNINNVLSKINEKEFYVETQLIQCLQPLNQWVTDLAIYLIVSLPQKAKSQLNHLPGAGLAQNKEALEVLRELLVIIKIWGKQNPASLPVVYRLNDQLDVIGTLFKLLSIHYTMLNNVESDGQFLEECTQFANSITVSQFEYFLSATGVASPVLHSIENGTRLTMEYFHELHPPELAHLDKVEGSINMNGPRKIDIVRNISLGAHPLTNVRHCTRCRAVSLMRHSFNTNRVWEQRWISTCVCGGHWALSDGVFSNKMSLLSLMFNANNYTSPTQNTSQLAR